jgi:hypothetical protein
MTIRLIVTGADSEELGRSIAVPVQVFGTFDAAKDAAFTLGTYIKAEGYHLTPAGIYLRSSQWRRVVVIDENGIEWYPLGYRNIGE